MSGVCSVASMFIVLLGACAVIETPLLPERACGARTGSEIVRAIHGLSLNDRESILEREILAGNVPDFLLSFVPVEMTAEIGGQVRTVTLEVAPDYLGVGTDTDWFRAPMSPMVAQKICDRLDCTMPTRRMVDAIWAAAVHFEPFPFSPSVYDIVSSDLFHRHHLEIERQRAGFPNGVLVAGIKKDVVISALNAAWPKRVVIYGWHHPDGRAIQPLSKVHGNTHVDYSHGVRLVKNRVFVDGQPTTVAAVLADPVLHPLLSDEGQFEALRRW